MRRTLLAVLTCTLFGVGVSGQTPAFSKANSFRSAVDLVALNVIATDAKDRFVSGLQEPDFTVFEDGVKQDIVFFASSQVPLDVALLLDVSASMGDHLATVQDVAVNFTSHLREGDRVTVIGVRGDSRTMHPLDGDIAGACDAIRRTKAGGSTALYNAVYTTIRQMRKTREQEGEIRRAAIVVLSDGEDNNSLISFDDVLTLAKQADMAIYTIALKSPYELPSSSDRRYYNQSDYAMKALAQETGARSFFPTTMLQLAGVYELITDELANQYAVGYTSSNPRHDGSYRRILVRVSTPNVRIRTRAGYQAEGSPPQRPARP